MTEKTKKTNTPKTSSPKTTGKSARSAESKSTDNVGDKQTRTGDGASVKNATPRTVARNTANRTAAGRADEAAATADAPLAMTMPETDEQDGNGVSKKKPAKKSTTRIITKDAEYEGSLRAYSGNAKIDQSVIDGSVFDDDVTEEPISGYYHKSMTIDDTMLSHEAVDGRRRPGKRRKQKTVDLTVAERYEPDPGVGLSSEVVEARIEQGYDNFVKKKSGKSYLSIFIQNIFTFFNILTFIVAAALIAVGAGATQLFFIVIITANIVIGIFQEIRSKMKIDKLSLVSAPSAVVIRDGERSVIPTSDVVLDDIICFEMGKQICTDSIVVRGECEVNESMLTGESEPVKKRAGDMLYSGSFISSGSVIARVEKVGAANYVETLTSHAKKYKKPKSELELN